MRRRDAGTASAAVLYCATTIPAHYPPVPYLGIRDVMAKHADISPPANSIRANMYRVDMAANGDASTYGFSFLSCAFTHLYTAAPHNRGQCASTLISNNILVVVAKHQSKSGMKTTKRCWRACLRERSGSRMGMEAGGVA